MDDRARRLGEHAAMTEPLWARQALGRVPGAGDPAARLDWEHRASVIAAYRERYGHDHPADPVGPEPTRNSPEARAAWYAALAAFARIDGIDLRHRTDGELWLRCGTYERETAWAPPHVTAELALVRAAGRDAHVHAIRAEHEARAARRHQAAARHHEMARRWHAVEAKAVAEERLLTDIQHARRRWEQVTEPTRRIAIAADTELRRRHPRQQIPALRPHPAESAGITWPEPADGDASPGDPPAARIGDKPERASRAARRDRRAREAMPEMPASQPDDGRLAALGLTLDTASAEIPAELRQAHAHAAVTSARLAELTSLPLPAT
jgi:hypothetical protein